MPNLVRQHTARIARLYVNGAPDPVALAAARCELSAAKLERQIREALDADHPITADQRRRLAALLVGGSR